MIEGKLEGRAEMMGRRGRRRNQLLDGLKEKRKHWKLKEEAPDRTLWRTRFGRGYGPVVRQATECMNDHCIRRPGFERTAMSRAICPVLCFPDAWEG